MLLHAWPHALVCLGRLDILDSLCAARSLHFIQSAAKKKSSQQNVWTGDEGLAWHPDSVVDPPSPKLHFLSLSSTLRPLLPSLPLFPLPSPPSPHPQLAVEDGFSESSWDQDQRQITADVYAKCNMETPQLCPHYWFFSLFFHALSLTPSVSPHFSASFLSKHNTTQCEIWRKKAPRTLFQMKQKRKEKRGWGGGGVVVPGYACLHLESILWCK